jgi:hypothetical protein
MTGTRTIIAFAAALIAAGACAKPTELSYQATAPEQVVAFVESEGLKRVQRIEVLLDIPLQHTQVFRVVYGDSFPVVGLCERGCGYAFPSAVGLRLREHVGWLVAADTSLRRRFDVLPSDDYLFTEDLFTRFERADVILFQQPFKALLASDLDTPEPALWMLVQGLSSWISPSLATRLLDNANVAANREMLHRISQLPVFQGDAYKDTRERAARMLAGDK